ncbi:MAG TPA: CRTAC1 family protein, partial [Blastocatellia bacterium]|nr:CRTAC1 family protein [Blastocatellia bacterium]
IYVANDYGEDAVYHNKRDGTFTCITRQATGGDFDAGMNVDFGDYDNDGYLDIYVTNITSRMIRQGNMLWRNLHDSTFANVAGETNTWDGGWGWGAKFLDCDNDGDLDIYTVNGYISDGPKDVFANGKYGDFFARLSTIDISDANTWPDMRGFSISGYEKSHLFRNEGGIFSEIAEASGLRHRTDGRGIAVADFDNDGLLDLFITNCGQQSVLYHNEGDARRWLEVQLTGTNSNADAIGARVTATAGNLRQIREVDGGNGFSSQSSRIVHFGLADHDRVDSLQIDWPGGKRQVLENIRTNQRLTVREASGSR